MPRINLLPLDISPIFALTFEIKADRPKVAAIDFFDQTMLRNIKVRLINLFFHLLQSRTTLNPCIDIAWRNVQPQGNLRDEPPRLPQCIFNLLYCKRHDTPFFCASTFSTVTAFCVLPAATSGSRCSSKSDGVAYAPFAPSSQPSPLTGNT
jgi:hypothetical protein